MDDTTKQPWAEPTIEPLTESDSRADVPDNAVRNVTPSSLGAN